MDKEKVVLNSPYGQVNNSITGPVKNGKTGIVVEEVESLFCLKFDNKKGAYWVSKSWVHYLEGLEPPLNNFSPGQYVYVVEEDTFRKGVVKAVNPSGVSLSCEYEDSYELIPIDKISTIKIMNGEG